MLCMLRKYIYKHSLFITMFTFKKIKFIVLIRKAIKEADLDEWNFDSLD